ncbi:MAG: hypothetical protein AAFP87_20480 [Pseudomonadota bacterium]
MSLFADEDLPVHLAPAGHEAWGGVCMMYPPALADRLQRRAGQRWRPANGTEGEIFEGDVCAACVAQDDCSISLAAMCYDIEDHRYPHEWVISAGGQPSCLKFKEP